MEIAKKIKNGKHILNDSKKALLVACYLYLKKRMRDDDSSEDAIIRELTTRKPYLNTIEIRNAISEWNRVIPEYHTFPNT